MKEYGRTIHFYKTNYVPLQGDSLYAGDMGHKKIVGEVGTGPGGS